MQIELVQQQLLEAARALVPAQSVCVYAVDPGLNPIHHLSNCQDAQWVALYPRFRDVDPFHPRYFAGPEGRSVFMTDDGRGSLDARDAFIAGFRQPMGIAYKAEVFLRDRHHRIRGGIRFSRVAGQGNFGPDELAALHAVQPIFSRAWEAVLHDDVQAELLQRLTPRERAVYRYLQQGLSNKLICRHLDLALPTVKTHVKNILSKANVNTRAELLVRHRA